MHYFTVVNNVTSTFASCLGRFLRSVISKSNQWKKRTTFWKINLFSQPRHECFWRSVRQSFHFLVALSIWCEKMFPLLLLRQGWEETGLFLAPVKLGYLVTLIMYSDFRPLRENEDTLFCKETREEGKKNVCKTNQDFSNQVRFLLQFILSAFFF